MKKNTSKVGSTTMLKTMSKFSELGYIVLTPLTESTKFDFVVLDENNTFLKVQAKTGKLCNGYVLFKTSTVITNGGKYVKTEQYDSNDVDLFAIWVPETDQYYKMKVNEVSKSSQRLRLTKINKTVGIKYAENYLLK